MIRKCRSNLIHTAQKRIFLPTAIGFCFIFFCCYRVRPAESEPFRLDIGYLTVLARTATCFCYTPALRGAVFAAPTQQVLTDSGFGKQQKAQFVSRRGPNLLESKACICLNLF